MHTGPLLDLFTLPTGVKNVGYLREQAQLLTIPYLRRQGPSIPILVVALFCRK